MIGTSHTILNRLLAAATAVLLSTGAVAQEPIGSLFADAPEGFVPPPLHPEGVQLQTRALGEDVYALLSSRPAVDNSGFIVGRNGVLVIDAHINGAMARQIQEAVRRVTDKPILYLVNTNYHGDHTFGNYAFPAETLIIAHRNTADSMRQFEAEKEVLLPTVDGDRSVYSAAELRLPDITFTDHLQVDLGSRVVEVYHFGPGNTQGDTVVYEPRTRTAWTGNLIVGEGTVPPIFEGGTSDYLQTISRFAQTLDVETVIPGHGVPADGKILGRYLRYLSELIDSTRRTIAEGGTLDQALAWQPLGEAYLPPAESEMAQLLPFLQGLHRLNVQRTYQDLVDR